VPDDINAHIATWEAILNKYAERRNRLLAAYPALTWEDVRPSLYGLPANALVQAFLSTKMTQSCLLRTDWWKVNVPQYQGLAQWQKQTDEFVLYTKMSVFLLFFSYYESIIRQIVRAYDPKACNNATDAFANVYTFLLTQVGLTKYLPMMDFARTMRNLIHNNGVYYGKKGKDEELKFDGKSYKFEHGKPVVFAYPETLYGIYEQVLSLSDDLNAHPDIMALPPTSAPQPPKSA
jgi:hypothetical protein